MPFSQPPGKQPTPPAFFTSCPSGKPAALACVYTSHRSAQINLPMGMNPVKSVKTWSVTYLSLAIYVGSLNLLVFLAGTALYWICKYPSNGIGWTLAAFLVTVGIMPISWTDSGLLNSLVRMTCIHAEKYFPLKVIVEDEAALQACTPCLLALEPHSCLPLGIPTVFSTQSQLLPKAIRGEVHGMASTVCFWAPFIRQLWWALGLRPASKEVMIRLLSEGKSVVICPGGVQECLFMDHDSETLFLKKRIGFIRMAMQQNVPLVPVFVFGQSRTYHWYRPGPAALVHWISRRVGAVPLAIWGRWGTPLPLPHPMTVVIGKPLRLPHLSQPSREQVTEQLQRFIQDMEVMIKRHQAACGYPDLKLHII